MVTTLLLVILAGQQLPANAIEPINTPACESVAKGAPLEPEAAAATGCFRVWATAKVDEQNDAAREAIRQRLHRVWVAWQMAQAGNRGHYAVRRMTAEETTDLSKTQNAPAASSDAPSWTGSGSKDTDSFSVPGGEWRVIWHATPTSPRVPGTLSITVHDANSGRIVSMLSSGDIGIARQDSSVVRTPAGRYYLSINSALVNWQVRVAQ